MAKDPNAQRQKTAFNVAVKELKKAMIAVSNASLETYLSRLSPSNTSDHNLWKAARYSNHQQRSVPPLSSVDGDWLRTDQQKAHAFANHLQEVFSPWNSKSCSSENKTPGYDLITGKVLRELSPKCLTLLRYIYNAVLRLQYFPNQWKVSEIILILKPGKKSEEVASYRPISLLPSLFKVLEKLLLTRIKSIMDNMKLIPNHQFGFRSGHSAVQQIHRVVEYIGEGLERKSCTAAFLDFCFAFDRVWHA
ncbi:hypothetical protein DMENIID0001_043810 [Sergentomyia squamirostris]